ncbi:Iron-sulfur cluster carrier protein [Candidatus Gugararchaeum adminiculabundum]|nr:Iron-sulfur cluster carrier protein [Candidatus Gugararchaeum adminiculabundum]
MREKRVVGIVSGKGGVGKSTISVNLSALMSEHNLSILLIDSDIGNPCVGVHLGIWQHTAGLQDALAGKAKPEQLIISHPATGIRVLPASLQYKHASMDNLKDIVSKIEGFEIIVIDSPPGITEEVEAIIDACTDLVVVTTADLPSVSSATKIVELARGKNKHVIGIALNRVISKKYELHPREIEAMTDCRLLTIIPEDRAVPESIGAGIPLVLYRRSSDASLKMVELAGQVSAYCGIREGYSQMGIIQRLLLAIRRILPI